MNNVEDFISSLSCFVPLELIFFVMRKGAKIMRKSFYESKLKSLDKKDLFDYLVSDRIFMESFTDEDLKKYYKYLKDIYSHRKINRIKKFFKFNGYKDELSKNNRRDRGAL